jgi:hypothetical protein
VRDALREWPRNPLICRLRHRRLGVRWFYPPRFPCRIVYRIEGDSILVLGHMVNYLQSSLSGKLTRNSSRFRAILAVGRHGKLAHRNASSRMRMQLHRPCVPNIVGNSRRTVTRHTGILLHRPLSLGKWNHAENPAHRNNHAPLNVNPGLSKEKQQQGDETREDARNPWNPLRDASSNNSQCPTK